MLWRILWKTFNRVQNEKVKVCFVCFHSFVTAPARGYGSFNFIFTKPLIADNGSGTVKEMKKRGIVWIM